MRQPPTKLDWPIPGAAGPGSYLYSNSISIKPHPTYLPLPKLYRSQASSSTSNENEGIGQVFRHCGSPRHSFATLELCRAPVLCTTIRIYLPVDKLPSTKSAMARKISSADLRDSLDVASSSKEPLLARQPRPSSSGPANSRSLPLRQSMDQHRFSRSP